MGETLIVVVGGVWALLLVTRVSGHRVQSLGQGTAPRRARTRPGPRARKEVGNEHTQSIRAEQSGGRGKTGTMAGFWEEQELEWGVNRNRMGGGSPGTPGRGRNPSPSQIDPKQTEETVTQALVASRARPLSKSAQPRKWS